MTIIIARMANGKSCSVEFHKPFGDITASEIMEQVNGSIWGWEERQ